MTQTMYTKIARRHWALTLRWLYLIWKFGGTSEMIGEKVSPVRPAASKDRNR
jgi:hypothetical protein